MRILQIIPADGWSAVSSSDGKPPTKESLIAWALVEEDDEYEANGLYQYVAGVTRGEPGVVMMPEDWGNFEYYLAPGEDLSKEEIARLTKETPPITPESSAPLTFEYHDGTRRRKERAIGLLLRNWDPSTEGRALALETLRLERDSAEEFATFLQGVQEVGASKVLVAEVEALVEMELAVEKETATSTAGCAEKADLAEPEAREASRVP